MTRFRPSVSHLPATLCAFMATATTAWAGQIPLQQPTATGSQPNFDVGFASNNVYQFGNVNNAGWALFIGGGTNPQTAAFETVADIAASNRPTTLRFNLFAGGFTTHTLGRYRVSYTTDNRAAFADGLANGGDVLANWNVLTPDAAISSGGATLTVQGDGSILASGANPETSTDSLYVTLNTLPVGVTGFRLEAMADPSLATNGPGRATNGNIVLREFDVAAFDGQRYLLQNGTALRSQANFSIDTALNGDFDFENANNSGWANAVLDNNVATFETATDIGPGAIDVLTMEIMSGGFGTHTLGKFRVSATTADRSLFADGNDNGGAGVGAEGIWTVLDPLAFSSDNALGSFIEDATHAITVGGPAAEYEHYTLTFRPTLSGITGFRIEALEDASFPANGPGRGSNGNFVVREIQVYAALPEPSTFALAGLACLALLGRKR